MWHTAEYYYYSWCLKKKQIVPHLFYISRNPLLCWYLQTPLVWSLSCENSGRWPPEAVTWQGEQTQNWPRFDFQVWPNCHKWQCPGDWQSSHAWTTSSAVVVQSFFSLGWLFLSLKGLTSFLEVLFFHEGSFLFQNNKATQFRSVLK